MLETLRSRPARARARGWAEFEEALADRAGRRARVGGVQRHGGAPPGVRAAGIERGRRVVTTPFSFVASANCVLYEGAEPVFCDIDPRTLNIDPAAAAAAVDDRTTGLLPVHIFGYPADMPAFEALAAERGLWIVEDACEALGAVHADGTARGRPRQPGHLRLLPEQAAHHGGGGRGGLPVAPSVKAARSTASATRAARRTWAGSTTTGWASTTASTTSAARSALAQLERLDAAARRPRPGCRPVRRGAGRDRGARAAVPGRRRRPPLLVRLRGAAAARRGPRRRVVDAARARRRLQALPAGDPPDAFYRERFGHREGEFPVCEDVAARSLALPFFGG